MRTIRDRADARWLPSRFNFALFRLFAYLRLHAAKPEPQPGLILSINRYQSAAENYIVCIGIVIVVASFFDSPLIGIPAAILGLQLAIVLARPIARTFRPADASTIEEGSWLILFATVVGAVLRPSPIGLAFLAIVVLNAVAATVMFLLRGSVERLEKQFE